MCIHARALAAKARDQRTMSDDAAATADAARLQQLVRHPFACGALLKRFYACVEAKGWEKCTIEQAALDECLEAGERRRFRIEERCQRQQRKWQSCLLSEAGDVGRCHTVLRKLHECCDAAN